MKWHITRKRLLAIIIVLFTVLVVFALNGCIEVRMTKKDEEKIKHGFGIVSMLLGLPPGVGEGTGAAVCSAITYFFGKKRGRRQERACHVPKAQPAKVDTP